MIHVIATIRTQPGKRADVVAAFKLLVPEVLAEDGCLAYEPTIDADTGLDRQEPAGSDAVIMVERWESVDHLKAHLAAPHMAAFREKHGHMIESASLAITQPG